MSFEYVGTELDLFANARNWRAYWASHVEPILGSNVLEIGAGIGSVTTLLNRPDKQWTAVEPDPALAERIPATNAMIASIVIGSIESIPPEPSFDSVLYIDVIEHIEDHATELTKACARLRPGGHLVVLAPAHQWLYTPFDRAIGHYRRYDRRLMRDLQPADTVEKKCIYLDSAGTLASAANRLLLRSSAPTPKQIDLWDTRLVPISRRLDPLLRYRLGKSILTVWQKTEAP